MPQTYIPTLPGSRGSNGTFFLRRVSWTRSMEQGAFRPDGEARASSQRRTPPGKPAPPAMARRSRGRSALDQQQRIVRDLHAARVRSEAIRSSGMVTRGPQPGGPPAGRRPAVSSATLTCKCRGPGACARTVQIAQRRQHPVAVRIGDPAPSSQRSGLSVSLSTLAPSASTAWRALACRRSAPGAAPAGTGRGGSRRCQALARGQAHRVAGQILQRQRGDPPLCRASAAGRSSGRKKWVAVTRRRSAGDRLRERQLAKTAAAGR